MSELKWVKTTFGELKVGDVYSGSVPDGRSGYDVIFLRNNGRLLEGTFTNNESVHLLVTPEREALEKYKAFFDGIVEALVDAGVEIESEVISDIGVKLGLFAWGVYDSNNETIREFCGEWAVELEDGDPFWYVVESNPEIHAIATAALEVKS